MQDWFDFPAIAVTFTVAAVFKRFLYSRCKADKVRVLWGLCSPSRKMIVWSVTFLTGLVTGVIATYSNDPSAHWVGLMWGGIKNFVYTVGIYAGIYKVIPGLPNLVEPKNK